jgi:formamidopyrimidine-DNA glycosylase
MPELPEVETIRRQLQQIYCGETILTIKVNSSKILKEIDSENFVNGLKNKTIREFCRYGKNLFFNCEDIYPVFHLGMSGIFLKSRDDSLYPQHIHIEFVFLSGKELFYQDMRKFGKVWLSKDKPRFDKLGVDPMDEKFALNTFKKLLTSRNMNLKLFLMDQTLIAGIGNIYANEILFHAGILPFRKTGEIINSEIAKIYKAILLILTEAIDKYGTSYSAYRTVSGEPGDNQNFLKVYHREARECFICKEPIQKTIMGSRSTFYCKNCQK